MRATTIDILAYIAHTIQECGLDLGANVLPDFTPEDGGNISLMDAKPLPNLSLGQTTCTETPDLDNVSVGPLG